MSMATEVIIWISPFLFTAFLWLAHEFYSSFKEDIQQLKISFTKINFDLAQQGAQISNLDSKLSSVCRAVEDARKTIHHLDKITSKQSSKRS